MYSQYINSVHFLNKSSGKCIDWGVESLAVRLQWSRMVVCPMNQMASLGHVTPSALGGGATVWIYHGI